MMRASPQIQGLEPDAYVGVNDPVVGKHLIVGLVAQAYEVEDTIEAKHEISADVVVSRQTSYSSQGHVARTAQILVRHTFQILFLVICHCIARLHIAFQCYHQHWH